MVLLTPEITVVAERSWEEIEAAVRETHLLHYPDVFPYEDAKITLEPVGYEDTRTTSLYVARSLLRRQAQIRRSLALQGYDPLDLEGGLLLDSVDDEGEPIQLGLVPPIVEVTKEEGAYLLDGSHRTNQGRWLGRSAFFAIRVEGIRPDCPAYAYPNDLEDVTLYDNVPEDPGLRKRYRSVDPRTKADYYKLYRDFGPLNGSTPRFPIIDNPEE